MWNAYIENLLRIHDWILEEDYKFVQSKNKNLVYYSTKLISFVSMKTEFGEWKQLGKVKGPKKI